MADAVLVSQDQEGCTMGVPESDQAGGVIPEAVVWEKFYDSRTRTFPPGPAKICVYGDGNPADIGLPPDPDQYQIHSITRVGGIGARRAQILDYEPDLYGDPNAYTPGMAHAWADRRISNGQRCILYSDRVDLLRLHGELGKLWGSLLLVHWIATGDNIAWTPAELSLDVERFGVTIPAGKIWGNQNSWGMGWDTSNLFGTW